MTNEAKQYNGPRAQLTLEQLQVEATQPYVQHLLTNEKATDIARRPEALFMLAQNAARAIRAPGYIARFVRMQCAEDMLNLGVFPNIKEITESMAALAAARRLLGPCGWRSQDPNVTAVVVGDGATPRTAALLAFTTRWDVHSIDPCLHGREAWWQERVLRLHLQGCKVEDATPILPGPGGNLVVFTVHSHAPWDAVAHVVRGTQWYAWVSIPCCKQDSDPSTQDKPLYDFVDYWIRSPERRVKVWTGVHS